jgi:hypothetical protein
VLNIKNVKSPVFFTLKLVSNLKHVDWSLALNMHYENVSEKEPISADKDATKRALQ